MADFQVPRWSNVQDIRLRSFSFMFAITNVICYVILRSRAIWKNLPPFQIHINWQQEVIFASWIQQFRILAFLLIQHSYNFIIILKFILLCIFFEPVCFLLFCMWYYQRTMRFPYLQANIIFFIFRFILVI